LPHKKAAGEISAAALSWSEFGYTMPNEANVGSSIAEVM
jgi:hypothetical protein